MADTEQLKYKDLAVTGSLDISFPRGDGYRKQYFTHPLGAAANVVTARVFWRDSSDNVVLNLSLENDAARWSFATSNQGILTYMSVDTRDLDVGTYTYGIEVAAVDLEPYTAQTGSVFLFDDVADDDGTAPYLGWATRAAIDNDLTQIAASFCLTYTSAAASSGGSSLSVEDPAFFAAGDIARVILDDGTYQDVSVATVTSTAITFSPAALADDVAKGNVVRKVV